MRIGSGDSSGGDWSEWRLHILKTMELLSDSIDAVRQQQKKQGETLLRNTASLEDHIKRTNLLEEKMDKVEAADNRMQGAMKLVLILGTIAGIATAITALIP